MLCTSLKHYVSHSAKIWPFCVYHARARTHTHTQSLALAPGMQDALLLCLTSVLTEVTHNRHSAAPARFVQQAASQVRNSCRHAHRHTYTHTHTVHQMLFTCREAPQQQ